MNFKDIICLPLVFEGDMEFQTGSFLSCWNLFPFGMAGIMGSTFLLLCLECASPLWLLFSSLGFKPFDGDTSFFVFKAPLQITHSHHLSQSIGADWMPPNATSLSVKCFLKCRGPELTKIIVHVWRSDSFQGQFFLHHRLWELNSTLGSRRLCLTIESPHWPYFPSFHLLSFFNHKKEKTFYDLSMYECSDCTYVHLVCV